MEIIRTSRELSAADKYFLTMSPATAKMKNAVGREIGIDCWAIFIDEDEEKGKAEKILAIQTTEGEVVATNSATFHRDFLKMWELFESCGETVHSITVISGKSKADRDFITCVYAS